MKKMIEVDKKSIDGLIEEFLKQEKEKELVLEEVFAEKDNNDILVVLKKVTLLNAFYSTQLLNNHSEKKTNADILQMAKHIHNIDCLDRLMQSENIEDNFKAYESIGVSIADDKTNEARSFASKYCSWHYPEKYPIMDKFSRGFLFHYNSNVKKKQLSDYRCFCEAYKTFRKNVNEKFKTEYSNKDLDMFIWMYGKKHPEIGIN